MTTENRTWIYSSAKNLLRNMVLICSASFAMVSCQNEQIAPQDEFDTPLVISTGVGMYPARSVVTGNTLDNGSSIGVTVVDKNGSKYETQDYNNVRYTASKASDGSQKWDTTTPIMLSGETGTLYAYYPYRADIDIENISIDLKEDEVVDWMYATEITSLDNQNAHAQIKLNHALAKLKVSLVKGNFVGSGNVASISLTSGGAATAAVLNARTGQLKNVSSAGTKLVYPVNETLDDEPLELNLLFVPTSQSSTVKIDVVVDNRNYTATASTTIKPEAGQSYNYTLIQNSTKLEMSQVTVTPWQENPNETLETDKVK